MHGENFKRESGEYIDGFPIFLCQIKSTSYNRLSKVSLMALMKSRLFRMTGFSQVDISDRLLVIFPSSTVLMQARSSLSATAAVSGPLSRRI